MTRYHVKYQDDPSLPPITYPFTPEEEAEWDALVAVPAPLSLEDQVAALKSVLIQTSIVKQADLDNAVTNIVQSDTLAQSNPEVTP